MFFHLISTFLISALAVASPTLSLHPRQSANLTFTVTNFTAFMADPYVEGAQSSLSFHVVDSRPDYYAEVDCVIPPTYFSLWAITALFEYCGDRSLDFAFLFGNGQVAVRRGWVDKNGKSYTATAYQNPYWRENGTNPNVTVTPTGKQFTQEGPWLFPVSRIQG
jgi:hypothetical protein